MFAQASAATAIASSTAELPVSVRRNRRSGVCRFRPHNVRPDKGPATGTAWLPDTAFPSPIRTGTAAPRT
jgi:hypothetical protein